MAIDTDVLEQDQGIQTDTTPDLPSHPGGVSKDRQELREAALDEAGESASQENVVDQLAEKEGELTVEDLKRLPGAAGLSDEEITAEWQKAVKAETGQASQQDGESFKLPFPVYDAQGNKIDALEKISVRDLLEGKLQIGYNALGKEQRKTLTEALRNASMGHWNEKQYNTTLEERNRVRDELNTANERVAKFTAMSQKWDAALTALNMGNIGPMKQLADAWGKQLTDVQQEIPGMLPQAQVEQERQEVAAGNQFIQSTIIPASVEIAQRYGADLKEVQGAIEFFLRRDMGFLTRDKINDILQYEVPQLFETNGYSSNSPNRNGNQSDVAELRKTVEALQSRIADKANSQTESVRTKLKKAPPSGSGATPGAGDSMPSFKSRAQFKAYMSGDEDWAKA